MIFIHNKKIAYDVINVYAFLRKLMRFHRNLFEIETIAYDVTRVNEFLSPLVRLLPKREVNFILTILLHFVFIRFKLSVWLPFEASIAFTLVKDRRLIVALKCAPHQSRILAAVWSQRRSRKRSQRIGGRRQNRRRKAQATFILRPIWGSKFICLWTKIRVFNPKEVCPSLRIRELKDRKKKIVAQLQTFANCSFRCILGL